MERRIANAIAIAIHPVMASVWHPEMAHSTPLLTLNLAGFFTHLQSPPATPGDGSAAPRPEVSR